MTAHAQAQCWKGSSSHETAMPQSVAVLHYSGYRARAGYVLYRALVPFVDGQAINYSKKIAAIP